MGITYERASDETQRLINRVLIEHHGELHDAGVRIDALMACKIDRETGEQSQALKDRNYPIAAKIQVTSYADRVRGIADAKLTIDAYAWSRLPETRREALIDHELEHLDVVIDKEGQIKRDDLGRPKLKIRPHDFELGWFTAVAERHGEAAIEVREIQHFHERWGQLCLFPMAGTEITTASTASVEATN